MQHQRLTVVLFVLLFTSAPFFQVCGLSGTVHDKSGKGIEGALVALSKAGMTATSDSSGSCRSLFLFQLSRS